MKIKVTCELHKLKYRVRLNTNVTALGTLTEKKII